MIQRQVSCPNISTTIHIHLHSQFQLHNPYYQVMNEVKQFIPFNNLADSMESTNRTFSYYIRKYTTDKVYQIYQANKAQNNAACQEIYPQLDAMIKKTEELNRNLEGQIALKPNLMEIASYAQRLFEQADNEYKSQRGNSEAGKNFQAAWRLLEVVNYFSKLTEDQERKRQFAKSKSMELTMQQSFSNPIQTPTVTFQPYQPQSRFVQPQGAFGGKKRISQEKVVAQTTAINQLHSAVSELQFNRVQYAKEAIRNALALIQKYQD